MAPQEKKQKDETHPTQQQQQPQQQQQYCDEHESLLTSNSNSKNPQHAPPNYYDDTLSSCPDTEIEEIKPQDQAVFWYFLFICFSTAVRSLEAGFVSSRMADIAVDLHLDYTQEGTISASPDYGIAPGALLGGLLVFRTYPQYAHTILIIILWGCAFVAIVPLKLISFSESSLVVARALGGLLWAQAATHYPVWIDRKAPTSRKTLWLACTNICLLGGCIGGYMIGGACRTLTHSITWVELYYASGVGMALCAILAMCCFDHQLVNIHTTDEETSNSNCNCNSNNNTMNSNSNSKTGLWYLLKDLFGSVPFVLAVAITGCISGGIVFALYFSAQVAEARGIDPSTTFILCMLVFVTAPAPGVWVGSTLVQRLGGYTDHVATFRVSLASAVAVLISACCLPLSWYIWGNLNADDNDNAGHAGTVAFVVAFWMFAFCGAMVGPPMNGIAVSAVPHASHAASALQFSMANAAKIVVPQLGGWICNISWVGLIDGFHCTLILTAILFVVISWLGLIHAQKQQQEEERKRRANEDVFV
jgi:hypothetical protein